MQEAGEAARRRELQRRAYAPGGALSAAELAELHELQNRGRGATAGSEPRAEEVLPPAASLQVVEPEPSRPAVAAADDASTAMAPTPSPPSRPDAQQAAPGSSRARVPVRRRVLAGVAAVAALLGLGAGWLLFGTDLGRTAMTAEQQAAWSDLETAGEYDAGSIHLVGEKYGATTWRATRDDEKLSCLILTRKDLAPAGTCMPAGNAAEGFELQVTLDYAEDGDHYLLWAMIVEDSEGEPVAVIQRQNMGETTWDWRAQYSQEELALAEVLDGSGFAGEHLQILGYDGAMPVWLYQQDRTCLLAVVNDVEVVAQCGMLTDDASAPLELKVGDVVYSAIDTNRGATLTVIRGRAACDPATGACTSIDDTTGDIG